MHEHLKQHNRETIPAEDLGIAHRGAQSIIKPEFVEKCVFTMGNGQTKQYEILSSSSQEYAASLANDAGVNVAFGGFKLAASRSVRTSSDLHKLRYYAKKSVSIQKRSLNIRQDCLKDKQFLHEGFYTDLTTLPRYKH